jgi:hypothetical protein
MARDYNAIRRRIHDLYARDHSSLGEKGAHRLLDKARQWDLAPLLRADGVVVFPHATVTPLSRAAAINLPQPSMPASTAVQIE